MASGAGKMLGIKHGLLRPGNCKGQRINPFSKGGAMLRKSIIICLFLTLILALATICQAGERRPTPRGIYKGQVIKVHDGDTPRVVLESPLGDAVRWLRLDGADCPELNQPWGKEALSRALELIQGQKLIIELTGRVTYGRPVARIWLPDGRELGAVLVSEGLAWIDPRYAKGARGKALKALQAEAQAARRGLWADDNPIAPWKWRKGERGK